MQKRIARDIIKQIKNDVSNNPITITHNGVTTCITGVNDNSIIFTQNGNVGYYDFCDFVVTFNHFANIKSCCRKDLEEFLPEIYGGNAKPCRVMLFMKIIVQYQRGKITSVRPYRVVW